jgi:hypothetical protein
MTHYRMALVVLAAAVLPAAAGAQKPRPARRQAPIEIRGQVPTPQVVTVRPREVPAYSRQVLVPRFYDHDFWPEIQAGYQLVPKRQVTGNAVVDSLVRTSADSMPLPVGIPNFFADSSARSRRPATTGPATTKDSVTGSKPSGS